MWMIHSLPIGFPKIMDCFHRPNLGQNTVRHAKLLFVGAVVIPCMFYATFQYYDQTALILGSWPLYFMETNKTNLTSTEIPGLLQDSSSANAVTNTASTNLTINTNTTMALNSTSSVTQYGGSSVDAQYSTTSNTSSSGTGVDTVISSSITPLSTVGKTSNALAFSTIVDTVVSSSITTLSTVGKAEKLMTSYMSTGRLGNKMGAHAVSLGLAQMNGYKPVMCKYMLDEMGQYFDFTTPLMDEESNNKNWTRLPIPVDHMQEQYRHLNDTYIQVHGYVNSWTFFHHIKPVIVKEFAFKKVLQDEAHKILWEISNTVKRNVTFVGVHVRRTDKLEIMPNQWKGVVGDEKYIEQAMAIFRERYNNSIFVVISDDRPWCRKNLNTSKGDVFFPGTKDSSPGQDMATLVACNHTIMTIGTFGFWSSYLCGGDVIYLANYTVPDSPLLNIIQHNASYLPEWYGINADLSPLLGTTAQTTILSALKSSA